MWQQLFGNRGFYLGVMFHRAARRHGPVPVILDRPLDVAPEAETHHTYQSIAELVDELAARLGAAGVRRGDHVAVHKEDNFDIAVLTCAVARLGAIPALLSPTLSPPVVAQLLARLDRPWLLTDKAKLDDLEPVERTLIVPLDEFAGSPRRPPVRIDPREPAMITHSSGTTGLPKLALHFPNAMWNRLVPQKMLGWPTRGQSAALCMSYVHSRFYHALGVFLHYGSPLLILVDHDPRSVGPRLVQARPSIVETHPNTFVLWEELADAPGAPLSTVRCYGSTFDAIHPRTVQRLLNASHRRMPYLIQLYGQSETGPVAASWFTRRGAAKSNGRLVGTRLPGFTRLRVVDADGQPCRPGVPGHIEARTRGRILTYVSAPEQFAKQVDGAWWRMGDVGYRNRWGALHLIDREIDQITDVDSNLEIEDLLMSRLDELREIVIVRGNTGEAVPVVCTKGDRPLSPDRWHDATADLKVLSAPVVCRFDDLPRTGTWKIKRVEIARLFAEGNRLVANWSSS